MLCDFYTFRKWIAVGALFAGLVGGGMRGRSLRQPPLRLKTRKAGNQSEPRPVYSGRRSAVSGQYATGGLPQCGYGQIRLDAVKLKVDGEVVAAHLYTDIQLKGTGSRGCKDSILVTSRAEVMKLQPSLKGWAQITEPRPTD